MKIYETKKDVKELADEICAFACNISWGKLIHCEWEGDQLVFTNTKAPFCESTWNTMQDDVSECCALVCHATGYEYQELDTPDGNPCRESFRCALLWVGKESILGYEIRKDELDDGTDIYDIYALYNGDSECLDDGSFRDRADAVIYIRKNLKWKGEIK